MSLLLPDTVTLFISPGKVQGVRTSALFGQIVKAYEVDIPAQADDAWLNLSKACSTLWKALRPGQLHLVLSDSMVRYACFHWRPELRSAQEDLAYAKLGFDDVYGTNASADWHLAFSDGSPGSARLQVAVQKSLFDLLTSQLSEAMAPVKSFKTAMTHALSQHRRSLGGQGWLVNVGSDTVTFGSWSRLGWTWINTVRANATSGNDLIDLINQELTIAGAVPTAAHPVTMAVYAPGQIALDAQSIAGVQLVMLKPVVPRYTLIEVQA